MMTSEGESMAKKRSSGVLHLLTPAATLQALREPTAGVDLMDRHSLHRHMEDSRRVLRRGISHFLSPQLQVLIKEKPRIALSEKADFAELLSEEPSGRPIQELSLELMGRSFMIRRRVATGSAGAAPQDVEEEVGVTRPPVPPDLPMEAQTTNKMSPAFAKKQAKRSRSPDNEEASPMAPDIKSTIKPFVAKLMAMKWPGWGNPFNIVLKKSNAPHRYFEYVKRPMNLTYIRDNVNRNKYQRVEELEADLELVVSNAVAFNPRSDPVHQYALELQAAFRHELPLLKRALEREQGAVADRQADKKPRFR